MCYEAACYEALRCEAACYEDKMSRHRLSPLFEPEGVIIAGASPHPGRFGTVALHNLLRSGYAGRVYTTSREGGAMRSLHQLWRYARYRRGE